MRSDNRRAGSRRGCLPVFMCVLALPFLAIGIPILRSALTIGSAPAKVVRSEVGVLVWPPELGGTQYVAEVVFAYEVEGQVHHGNLVDLAGNLEIYVDRESALAVVADHPVGKDLVAYYRPSATGCEQVVRPQFWVEFACSSVLLVIAVLWVGGAVLVLRYRARQHREAIERRRAMHRGIPRIGHGRRDRDVLLEPLRAPVVVRSTGARRRSGAAVYVGVPEVSSSLHPVRVGEEFSLRVTLDQVRSRGAAFELRLCRGARRRAGMVPETVTGTHGGMTGAGEAFDFEARYRIADHEPATRDEAEESVIWIVELAMADTVIGQWELQVAARGVGDSARSGGEE